jgi:hypothetical protein
MVFHIIAKLKNGGNIYPLIFHDIMRVIIIQVSTHILFYLSHHNIPLFSQYLFETLIFMVASLCVYWFCFYTLFPVDWELDDNTTNTTNTGNIDDNTTNTTNSVSDNRSDETPSVISL